METESLWPRPRDGAREQEAAWRGAQPTQEEEEETRALLRVRSTAEERRARNRGKRVKLHSKRLRQLWPAVARFLSLRDAVALAGTCHRMQRLLESDRLWLEALERVRRDKMTQLLVPRAALAAAESLSPRKRLQRLLQVRRSQDPTNALRLRLREAEREAFQLAAWQRKVREAAKLNAPVSLALLALSAAAFATDAAYERHLPPEVSGPAAPGVDPLKTFLLVQDALLLVALAVVSAGHTATNALATAAVLAAIEAATMLHTLATPSRAEPALAAHALVVGAALVADLMLALRSRGELRRELAGFTSSY